MDANVPQNDTFCWWDLHAKFIIQNILT